MNATAQSFAGETNTVQMIPVGMIHTAPQVRTQFKESTIHELAADIQANGVLQPLIVQKAGDGFVLIIGERRLRAIKHLGAPLVPAIVATITDEKREELQLIENIQREDLSTKDLAGSIERLWKKYKTVNAVARVCNKSKSWVSKRLALALKVGPLTAELLDASLKDVELIYGFTMLEKADEVAARALLPRLIDRTAGRADIKKAIAAALASPAHDNTDDEGGEDDTTWDMFDEQPASPVSNDSEAIKALRAIMAISTFAGSQTPLQKWERAREIAREALQKLDGMPVTH